MSEVLWKPGHYKKAATKSPMKSVEYLLKTVCVILLITLGNVHLPLKLQKKWEIEFSMTPFHSKIDRLFLHCGHVCSGFGKQSWNSSQCSCICTNALGKCMNPTNHLLACMHACKDRMNSWVATNLNSKPWKRQWEKPLHHFTPQNLCQFTNNVKECVERWLPT